MQQTKFFKKKFADKPVIDLAISGSTVVKGLQTFSDDCTNRQNAFLKLSKLVILLGTNDFLKSGRFDYTHYYDLTTYAVSSSSKKIILVKMPPIFKKPFLSKEIHQANIWIASIGRGKGLQVIEAPQNVSKDGVHLTEWGE
ncbi:unnamed protein product [Bemisia tabaci]|uniref:Uncharacterized protein n=1 Tax=Bemisia tabaci TaxID=7038 RepID=A0A9P0ABA8_BEMTA|nr:unnamed protein product [Bemisia tabaci]